MPTQSSHGFSVGDAIRHNGTQWSKAQADSASNAEVLAVVSAVADANNFTAVTSGLVSTLTGLTGGNLYYLSSSSAGTLTTTEPTTNGTVSKPVLYAISSSSGYVLNHKGKTNAATVDSVNGSTGTVVLDADNIDDASTSHKFVTSDDLTTLANTSGINTGDQDLSTYQLKPSEGAFANGDKTRLDNMADNADVTNTTNVTNAGALMDSEVTNLAQVKAFASSDYATAAQGSTADSALQNLSGDTTPSLGGPLDVAGQDIITSSNGDIEIDPDGSGVTIFKGNATKGSGQFKLNCEANTHGITIKGPPHSANADYTLTLPDDVGSASQILTTDGTSGTLTWETPSQVSINTQTGTTYTTVAADASKLITLNNGSAITLTIPPNSSVAYEVGTKIDLAQIGAGQVTVAAGAGVTVNATPTLKLRAQYSGASCIQYAADTWILAGDLASS